jgi:hypothetical protein
VWLSFLSLGTKQGRALYSLPRLIDVSVLPAKAVANKVRLLIAATAEFGEHAVVAAPRITEFAEKIGEPKPMWLFVEANRVSRGMYRIPAAPAGIPSVIPKINQKQSEQVASPQMSAQVIALNPTKKFDPNAVSEHSYAAIPDRDSHYVPFGEFKDIEKIVKSGMFFPVFVSGLSGNGKTFMVEQAASRAQRPMMRVQMSRETDEDDLIGGFRLIDGETKFLKGPVLRAMEIGALLLIDEADRADPGKVMCLQGILEGGFRPRVVSHEYNSNYPLGSEISVWRFLG